MNIENMSNSNVTDSYSYNCDIGSLGIRNDQIYIQQRGNMKK